MSSFLDSTGLSELATKLKVYFMKKPTSASTSSYPLVGYDVTNNVGKYNSDITLDLSKASAEVYSLGTNAKAVPNDNTYVRIATIQFADRDDASSGITGFVYYRDQNVINSGEAIFAISCADYSEEYPKGKLITLNVRNAAAQIIGIYLGVKKINSSKFELWVKFPRISTARLRISINKTSTSTVTWNNDSASATQPSGDYYEMTNCTLVESSGSYPNMTVGNVSNVVPITKLPTASSVTSGDTTHVPTADAVYKYFQALGLISVRKTQENGN